MVNRRFLAVVLMLALLIPVAVFAQDSAAAEVEPYVCPETFAGQTLNIFNWSTYVAEDNADTPEVEADTIKDFEAACGITITYTVFGSNDELFASLEQGNPGYDLIVPSDYMVEIMIAEEMLVALDHSLIPNLGNLIEGFTTQPYDEGNVYSVPYLWGSTGIGYDISKTGGEITSWSAMYDTETFDGQVGWLDSAREVLGAALLYLGYDPNTTDEAQIAEARDLVIDSADNIVSFYADDGQARLLQGDVTLVQEYNGDVLSAAQENEDLRFVIPQEGALGFIDNMAIPVGAPNAALAYEFINYILHPATAAALANYTNFFSPNQAAGDAGLLNYIPDPAAVENLQFLLDVGDALSLYDEAYTEITLALGQ